ncbi:MAG: hypothetical protein KIC84_11420 [Dysgonomonas mossii]|uniref:hypothetical protein n=1 Tax=Dysgonomonas mossii TaxID=163665 RepID=UPI0026F0FF6B|nr:hypothetical protein [Dysgonomonas mossii]MBS5907823.1 hypothetical protein [Dysgonomonas mossii]
MDALLTNQDVMNILSIKDRARMKELRRSGLNYLKIGSEYRYKAEWVEKFVNEKSSLSLNTK